MIPGTPGACGLAPRGEMSYCIGKGVVPRAPEALAWRGVVKRIHWLLPFLVIAVATVVAAQTPEEPATPEPATPPEETAAPAAPAAPETGEPSEQVEPPPNPDLDAALESFRKGDYGGALESARKVLASDPGELNALYIAGVASVRLGRLAEAKGFLTKLLELEPAYPNVYFHLGHLEYALAEETAREGQAEEAKTHYTEAARQFALELERKPGEVQVLRARALALARAGDIDGAIEAYEATIAAEPKMVTPYLALGSLYAELGRGADAMVILDRIPKENPKGLADGVFAIARTLYSKERYEDVLAFAQKMFDYGLDSRQLHSLLSATYARMGLLKPCAEELCKFMSMNPPPEETSTLGEVIRLAFGGDWAEEKGPATMPKGTRMPEVEKKYSPRYPPQARKDRIETTVMLMVLVKTDGSIGETCIVPSRILDNIREYGLEQAAIENVKRWRFRPASADRIPMDAWYPASVVFSLH